MMSPMKIKRRADDNSMWPVVQTTWGQEIDPQLKAQAGQTGSTGPPRSQTLMAAPIPTATACDAKGLLCISDLSNGTCQPIMVIKIDAPS
jgi:hypothetical protein